MADDTPPPPSQTGAGPAPPLAIVHGHFDVSVAPAAGQLLAWRERLGMIIDVLPSRATIALPFHGVMDRYEVGDLLFTDSRPTSTQERTIARISRDNLRRIAFHMVLSGANGCVVGRPANRAGSARKSASCDRPRPAHLRAARRLPPRHLVRAGHTPAAPVPRPRRAAGECSARTSPPCA